MRVPPASFHQEFPNDGRHATALANVFSRTVGINRHSERSACPAGSLDDRMDPNARYARATPEKALLDWIYLGASPRTKLSSPPLDTDLDRLNKARLRRLA